MVPGYREMIEFAAPRVVRTVLEPIPELTADKFLIAAKMSLVSTGTELKVYTGDFDRSQPSDLTIESMKDQEMRYPLRYG